MQRTFLGLQQPPLKSAAAFLVDSYRQANTLDLSQHVVILPGARAGRRLTEILFQLVTAEGLAFLPPDVTTVGQVPELLYNAKRPFATDWIQQLTWSWAVRNISPAVRDKVFPAIPQDADSVWSIESWLQLGRLLRGCYRELAADGLSFADVAAAGPSLEEFTEEERWQAMAEIQRAYLEMLDQRELWDRQTARMVAVENRECTSTKTLVLIGSSDLNKILRSMLDQVGDSVVALVAAPESWADRFDRFGCVEPAAWANAEIPIHKNQLYVADNVSDQSRAVIDALADLGGKYSRDQITIGCPDDELVPFLERALAEYNINGRWGLGRSIRESGPYRLLEIMCEWLRSNRFDAFAVLARHPDVGQWLLNNEVKLGWLDELDNYRNNHLPVHTTGKWLGPKKRRERLEEVWKLIKQLRMPFEKTVSSLPEWASCIRDLLSEIYGTCQWNTKNPHDRITFGAAKAINEVLIEQSQLPADIATSLDGAQALELVLEQVASTTIGETADPDAVEMVGWLELPLEDSPVLILTGMNEGVVPQASNSEMFLPNSLREHLAIDDNQRRYARDAFALSSLIAQRAQMPIIVGRRDIEGNPRVPSRLLFATDKETISRRWIDFFDAHDRSADGQENVNEDRHDAQSKSTFGFEVPRPHKLDQPIEKMRPTDFKLYLECPYRFYLKRVLRYRAIIDDESEMTGGAFGDVVHEVLNKFGLGRKKNSTDPSEIYSDLLKKLTAQCNQRYGTSPGPAVRIQYEQMKMRFREFSYHQARWAQDYEIAFVEEPTTQVATIETEYGNMTISGRIDRIDRHRETGKYVILDYKTSDSGTKARAAHHDKDLREWKDLQLPVYRRLARVMGVTEIENMGYVLLPKKLDDIGFDLANWSEQELAIADSISLEVVSKVLSETFWPPGKPEWADYDDYRHLLMEGILERAPLTA
jgi:hypothetical protein